MIKVGDILPSTKHGDFEIIEYINDRSVTVRFVDTGFTVKTQGTHAKNGGVRDRMAPFIYGIGYIGNGNYCARSGGKITRPYITWFSMLTRCYCKKFKAKNPTYIGCTVTEEWHDYQNFASWFTLNYIDGLQLDKDIKVKGNKIYSPDFCLFVTPQENAAEAVAKNYSFTSPNGENIKIYNLRGFCSDNNLHQSNMYSVHNGKAISHKGWKKSTLTPEV